METVFASYKDIVITSEAVKDSFIRIFTVSAIGPVALYFNPKTLQQDEVLKIVKISSEDAVGDWLRRIETVGLLIVRTLRRPL